MTELNARIPTVDEYLQLVDYIDWKFEPHVEKGMNGDFYWLRSKHLGIANPFNQIDLPANPFGVVVTYCDPSEGGVSAYASRSNWRIVDCFAVSNFSTVVPELYHHVDSAELVIDNPVSDDELRSSLTCLYAEDGPFPEPEFLGNIADANARSFWNAIKAINPLFYSSYGLCNDGFTLVTRGEELLQQFETNQRILIGEGDLVR